MQSVILDRRWFNENNMFKSFAKETIIIEPKRYYVKGYKRFECDDIDVEYYKEHATHKSKFDEGLTKDEFLAKCRIFSIYDCGRIMYHF